MSPGDRKVHTATLADLVAIPESERFHEIIDGDDRSQPRRCGAELPATGSA